MQRISALIPSLACAGVLALAPAVGDDCLETDYDCQPTTITEEQYDAMAQSVPIGRGDLPALVELDPLDSPAAPIQRFMLNARGIMGREVPIPASAGQFCTLSDATHVSLKYFPESGLWVFVIDFAAEAELLAGGLATCARLGGEAS